MIRSYTDEELLTDARNANAFKGFPEGYWIHGKRSKADKPNEFDDKFYLFKGEESIMVLPGTTNPGTTILQKGFLDYNAEGAALVKSNEWYHNLWTYGLHRGKMSALKQVGKIKVYRDGDKDVLSEEQGKVHEGYYGINFHASTYDKNAVVLRKFINNWSAGCQVCNDRQKYNRLIQLVKSQNRISYCLTLED